MEKKKYYHHNWLMRDGSEFVNYPSFFEAHKNVVTQEIWGMNYDQLHALSKSQIREQVAVRYCKERL